MFVCLFRDRVSLCICGCRAMLELAVYTWLALNYQRSTCLYLPSTGVKGVYTTPGSPGILVGLSGSLQIWFYFTLLPTFGFRGCIDLLALPLDQARPGDIFLSWVMAWAQKL